MNRLIPQFVALYQFFAFIPSPAVINSFSTAPDPPKAPIARPAWPKPIKKIAEIPASDSKPAEALDPVPVPQTATPAPNAQSSTDNSAQAGGCVTGYVSGDFYLDKIISFESGGNSCATNAGGCFGLLQACPGDPLREACGGDPSCQIAWFQYPANHKTGGRSWAEVWQHELDYGWW